LAQQLPQYSQTARQTMLDAVKNLFCDPRLQVSFDPRTSRGEVALMGTIASRNGPRSVSGQIDRLAVTEDEVIVLDYKTSLNAPATVEEISADYVTQLALYRQLVARLYPDKSIACYVVWTHAHDGPVVIQLEESRLDAAYEQIAQL
jgi:ATP-dependent helicase/nuclease subunit A